MSDAVAPSHVSVGQRLADLATLARLRLNSLTVFAVASGWWAAGGASSDLAALGFASLGAALVATGSSAINQAMERDRDRRMVRTALRPVAAGRMTVAEAGTFGAALVVCGLIVLLLTTNLLTAALGAFCGGWYLLAYTPLKSRSSLNTLVGAVSGAVPPVMGVAAVEGAITPAAWFLFCLLAVWQLPHFLAIAWLHREDYARGGFVMLPGVRGGVVSTARQVVVQSVAVLAVSLFAYPMGLAGIVYLWVSLAAGVVYLGAAAAFAVERSDAAARTLLRISVVHLPVVLAAFAIDSAVA